jgi:hypothetical protein
MPGFDYRILDRSRKRAGAVNSILDKKEVAQKEQGKGPPHIRK